MKRIIDTVLFAAIILWGTVTWTTAKADTVGLHLASAHETPGYNDNNPGVYMRLDNGATFGTYRNSLSRQTIYGGYTWGIEGTPFALTAVAMTGYRSTIVATLLPSVELNLAKNVAARVTFVYAPEKSSAVHFSLEYKL